MSEWMNEWVNKLINEWMNGGGKYQLWVCDEYAEKTIVREANSIKEKTL